MLQEELPRGAAHVSVKEVAIHISNHTMRKGDRGVVVIGASAELGDLANHGDAGRHSHALLLKLPWSSTLLAELESMKRM